MKDDPGNYPACLESFCGFIMFINFSYSYYYDFFLSTKSLEAFLTDLNYLLLGDSQFIDLDFFFPTKRTRIENKKISP